MRRKIGEFSPVTFALRAASAEWLLRRPQGTRLPGRISWSIRRIIRSLFNVSMKLEGCFNGTGSCATCAYVKIRSFYQHPYFLSTNDEAHGYIWCKFALHNTNFIYKFKLWVIMRCSTISLRINWSHLATIAGDARRVSNTCSYYRALSSPALTLSLTPRALTRGYINLSKVADKLTTSCPLKADVFSSSKPYNSPRSFWWRRQ